MNYEITHTSKEELNSFSPAAIILCTNNPAKHKGMVEQISSGEHSIAPVGSASAHTISEKDYNEALSGRPDLVSAVKAIQIAEKYPLLFQGVFENIDPYRLLQGPTIFIASDIMLDLRNANNEWKALQKLTGDLSYADIENNYNLFLGRKEKHNLIEGRFRSGAAALVVDTNGIRRGITGTIESYFWFERFTTHEIKLYLSKVPFTDLLGTNFGLHWEDELLQGKIRMLNGFSIDEDEEFPNHLNRFNQLVRGGLPGINNLIKEAIMFYNGNSQGKINNDVSKLYQELLYKYKNIGNWGIWQTSKLSY